MSSITLGKLEVAPIDNKMIETGLKWSNHMQKRTIDATMWESDNVEFIGTSRMR